MRPIQWCKGEKLEMSREEVFTTATIWAKMYCDFLQKIISEIGLPRTIELQKTHGEINGAMYVNEMQKQGKFDPEALAAFMKPGYEKMGIINIEIEATPDSLVVKNGKCPVYEGFKMAGMDDETIHKFCTNRESATLSAITEAFPEVKASLTRDKPDGYCTVLYKIEK